MIAGLRRFSQSALSPLCAAVVTGALHRLSGPARAINRAPALIIAPHQDDETFGCGGLIVEKLRLGASVRVLFLTDGAACAKPGPEWTPAQITALREKEARQALGLLGLASADIGFLSTPDSGLSSLPEGQRRAVIEEIIHWLPVSGPGEVYVTHRADIHPDHEAAYRLARAAVSSASNPQLRLLEYFVWFTWLAKPFFSLQPRHLRGAFHVSIATGLEQKKRAIAAYPSQLPGLPRGFTNRFMKPYEIFYEVPDATD